MFEALIEIVKQNPWVLIILLVLLVLVIAILIYVVLMGRELQIWQIKIGARPAEPAKVDKPEKPLTLVQTGESAPHLETGINLESYERDSRVLDAVKIKRIREAKDEIWLIGATMHYTIGNCKSVLIEQIQNGVNIYVLVADPEGEDFGATARAFGQDEPALRRESDITLASCEEIIEEIGESAAAKLEVRLLDNVFTCGAYFFDPKMDCGTMILVPHISGYDAPISPGFVFRFCESGTLKDYYGMYRKVFSKSVSLERWKEKHAPVK